MARLEHTSQVADEPSMARAGPTGKVINLARLEYTIQVAAAAGIARAADQAVKAQVESTGRVEKMHQVEDMLPLRHLFVTSCAAQVTSKARV
jgi:hypothetical protein